MSQLAQYALGERLFEGRTTDVIRGHAPDGRPVVLKVLRQVHPSPAQVDRFRHEYELLASVRSDHVVVARAFETDQRRWALVQDDFGGSALDGQLDDPEFDLAARLDVAVAVCRALVDTHEHGVLHKDINPSNIVRNPTTGEVRLIDFGLSTALNEENPTSSNRTHLQGTLRYISPEQTGRVAAPVDLRSDLYSFGATLYQLFSGRPPFESDDPLELVHAHIARPARPLHEAAPSVPPVLSDLVGKLLNKRVEDRYRGAQGLLADLQRCRKRLVDGAIPPFELGLDDVSDRLQIPPRLYGREAATRALLEALERTGRGSAGVLVTGPAGMGKTALVQQLFGPLTERRGYYLRGKFEQVRRTPLSAVVAAFAGLVTELLGESEGRLTRLRNDLAAALGPNGRLITDVLPQVELVVGPQPPVEPLGAAETAARFAGVFRAFVGVFARSDHPVVLFIDDLQWADAASLELLARLLTDEKLSLLVVGAFRDDEIGPVHPLTGALKRLADDGITLPRIELQPLSEVDAAALIVDATGAQADDAEALAALVVRNTEGNPLFVREYLRAMADGGLLRLDRTARRWSWDLASVQARAFTDSALQLMTARLARLDEPVQELVRVAACAGATFDLATVAALRGESVEEVWTALLPAVRDGVLVATSELDALIADSESPHRRCSFFHDRIQQAAYEGLTPEARQETHRAIGRRLLAAATEAEPANLFEIVFQLNRGRGGIDDRAERLRLARLNLAAGKRAAASAAWQSATDYLEVGLTLLPPDAWEAEYDLTLGLHRHASETTFANADHDRSRDLIEACLAHARTDLEQVDLYVLLARQRTTIAQYPEALEAARTGLALLGFELVTEGYMEAMLASFGELQALIAGRPASSFLDRPPMADPIAAAQCRLLSRAMAPAFYLDPLLYSVLSFEAMKLLVTHGNPSDALAVYAQYGHLLGALFGDPPGGFAWTQLSRDLCDRLGNPFDKAEACFLSGNFSLCWVRPLREARAVLEEGVQVGLQSGGLQFARYSLIYLGVNDFVLGRPLAEVLRDAEQQRAFCARAHDRIAEDCSQALLHAAHALAGNTDGPDVFATGDLDHDTLQARLEASGAPMLQCYYNVFQATALAVHGDWAATLAAADRAHALVATIPGNVCVGRLAFLRGLAIARVLPTLSGETRATRTEQLDETLAQLDGFAGHCAANWAHAASLVRAEASAAAGDGAAMEGYEAAIRLADEHDWPADHALACELAGRYWAQQGRPELSRGYLAQARYGYEQWGAAPKVAALDAEFSDLSPASKATPRGLATVSVTSTESSAGLLDLASVVKASQALSGEIKLERLLSRLMEVVLENAGAQRGVLVVVDEGELAVRAAASMADGETATDVSLNVSLAAFEGVSPAIIQYAARTAEPVVLNDALGEGRFAHDPHILRARPRSVLCLPLRPAGELIGLLYLENRDMTGAFTSDRLEIVTLLASQFGISFENARLYDEMEGKVARRTEQLADKNAELEGTLGDLRLAQTQLVERNEFIRSVFGRYVSGDVVEHLLDSPDALRLGGQRRPITVLASDVRGFTSLAERLEPEQVLGILNRYFEAMFAVILRHGGTINAILGDGLFVFFGAPITQPDAPRRAVTCALEMMVALDELKAANPDLTRLEMGIGVHTGHAVVGNIGSQDRAKYSAIGRDVNLAARIEACTVGGQILVSEATAGALDGDAEVGSTLEFSAKGIEGTLRLHEVQGLRSSGLRYRRHHAVLRTLREPAPLRFQVVSGGVVAPTAHAGELLAVSETEGELRTEVALAPLTDLKIQLLVDGAPLGDLYGKVQAGGGTRVGFTAVPPKVRAWLERRPSAD